MPITDFGIEQIGSFVAGLSPSIPGSVAFGSGSSTFDGDEAFLENEVVRNKVTWSFDGRHPRGNATLTTTQANGSVLKELGLVQGTSLGSDAYTRDLSGIGSKDNTFDVSVQFDWRSERP